MASKGDYEDGGSSHSVSTNLENNLAILKPLDEALRCRICFDYFSNCMVTKCSHNYCSLCIRRYMLYKSQCPTCFQDASEPELRNNRLIDEILRTYMKLKETLQSSIHAQNKPPTGDSMSVSSKKISNKKEFISSDDQCPEDEDKKNVDTDEYQVSCPVCYKPVDGDRINIHLDTCLKLQQKEIEMEKNPMPKLVYHLLSDKEIRKKLNSHGLNSIGSRQALIKRHKNFVTLYNANCDSLEPKPVSELVRELEVQEIEEKANVSSTQIQVHKKSDVSDIEKEFQSYAKEHQSQFNNLINDIQQRQLDRTVVKKELVPDDTAHVSQQSASKNFTREKSSSEEFSDESDSSESSRDSADARRTPTRIKTPSKSHTTKYTPKNPTDSSECDSPSLLGDLEQKTVTQLNLLRKRKKGKVIGENRSSPKKKDSSNTARKSVQS